MKLSHSAGILWELELVVYKLLIIHLDHSFSPQPSSAFEVQQGGEEIVSVYSPAQFKIILSVE